MAIPYPYADGRGRGRSARAGERLMRRAFNVVALASIAATPLASIWLWLLLTDPALAGNLADTDSGLPVARSLLYTLTKIVTAILAFL